MAGDSKAIVKKEGGNRKERRANEKSKVDNTHRRTWDKEDYEERAAAREKVRHRFCCLCPAAGGVLNACPRLYADRTRGGGECHRCKAQEEAR